MSMVPGHRHAVAILSIQSERADPSLVLIRVQTVDDTLRDAVPDVRPFSDAREALEHLDAWLKRFGQGQP